MRDGKRWLVCILLLSLLLPGVAANRAPAVVYAQAPESCAAKFGGSMVGYWTYDDQNDSMLPNYGDVRGTIVGGLRLTTGVVGRALSLGGYGYVNYGTTLNVPAWESYTVAIWFLNDGRLTPVKGYGEKIVDKTTMHSDFFLGVPHNPDQTTPHGVVFMYDDGFKNIQTSGYDYIDSRWHHAVITKAGTHGELWIDGTLIGSKDDLNPTINNQPLLLGYSLSVDSYQRLYWGGNLDEFAIFNRALTPAEIADLYTTSANGQSYCWGEILPPVNSTADPGDGRCDAAECTLREAMVHANASPGTSQIRFALPGAGPHVIRPLTPLPTITAPVEINGYTQEGSFMGTTSAPRDHDMIVVIEVDGSRLPAGAPDNIGFHVTSPNTLIQGFAIHSFDKAAIVLDKDAVDSYAVWNFIGSDVTGRTAPGNGIGIQVGPLNTTTGRLDLHGNLIVGNAIGLALDHTGTVMIADNRIGLGRGDEALGNGIGFTGGETDKTYLVDNLIINSTGAGVVQPQTGYFSLAASEVTRNAVGIICQGAGQCYLYNNDITQNVGNGILMTVNAEHSMQLNRITANGGNGLQVVGGTRRVNLWQNAFTANGGKGLTVTGNDPGLVVAINNENVFDNNGDLAIDLGDDGVTANDLTDSDRGPNGLLNFPELPIAETNLELRYRGWPSNVYYFSFFASPTCDPSGYGEGALWLGNNFALADQGGNIDFVLPVDNAQVRTGYYLTALARNTLGQVSEFSRCTPVVEPINQHLEWLSTQTHYNPNDPRAAAGVYQIVGIFRNAAPGVLRDIYFKSTTLEYEQAPQQPAELKVLNGEYVRAGNGYKVSVPSGYISGEAFGVIFDIALPRRESFRFLVDAYGVPEDAAAAIDNPTATTPFEFAVADLATVPTDLTDHQIYLPWIAQ